MSKSPHQSMSIFQGRFILTKLLGRGGFGEVYSAVQTSTGESVAVKMEKNVGPQSFLFHEARVMQDIQKTATHDGVAGIATLKYFGQEGDYRMLIMSLQGPSLEDFHERFGRFSLKTTVMLADQMLSLLEYIHSSGYVHRDLKPDNFLTGVGSNSHRLFVIDFGLSSKYISDGKHREMVTGKKFVGTSRYASYNTHRGYSQSRRDDIEQLVYIFVYMYRGRLPWSGLNIKDREAKEKRIGELKGQLKLSEICAKCPRQFEDLLFYTRNMSFTETPQYDMCRVLIRSVLDEMPTPTPFDLQFDWMRKPGENKSPKAENDMPPMISKKEPKAIDGPENANNVLSSAKGKGIFSGFGSTNSPKEIVSLGDRN